MKKTVHPLYIRDPIYGPRDLTPKPDTILTMEEQEELYGALKALVDKYGIVAVTFELAEVKGNA